MRDAAAAAVTLEDDPRSPWYALARTAYGFALYLCGDFENAAVQAEEALLGNLSIAMVRMLSYGVASLIAVEEGRLDRAGEYARAARGIVRESSLRLVPQGALAYTAAGAVFASQGRLEQARSEFECALGSRRRWPGISPWPTVEVLLRLAPVVADLGDRSQAAALVDEASHVLTSLPDGAEAQLARLGRLQRRVAGRPRKVSLAEALTDRELAVLRLLRGTLSLREIGQQLYLSQNTIKTHTRAIYRKLGVSTRRDALARAGEIDIL
jgi:LuxR family maltose regulon positive regulatory protein